MRIERGAVIADRYVVSSLERPWLADRPEAGSVCLALDAILDDPVILYAAAPEFAGDLMDAGRRLALISDPRVPDVLDVGEGSTEDGSPVVYVTVSRTAATSLAETLAAGPISPEATRAIAGEVSEVLVHAARRGLHHRCLGPESIGITRDGDLAVYGIAIDAALSEHAIGLEPQTDSAALREDSLAVVDILYACLSGMWPKQDSRAGLPPAPRKNTRVVDVETLRADLPEDLYSFVTGVTSRTDPGPRSPGEIIRYLNSWNRESLSELKGAPLPDDSIFPEPASDGEGPFPPAGGNTVAGHGSAAETDATASRDNTQPEAQNSSGSASAAGTAVSGAVAGAASDSITGGTAAAERAAASHSAQYGTGLTSSGARPTAVPRRTAEPTASPSQRSRATPAQIQAALNRIGMTRPGTSGYSAGRSDGVRTKLDSQMQMRDASVFPLTAQQLSGSDSPEWKPEDTIADYSGLAEQEEDRNLTAPIMRHEPVQSENLETQQMPAITEDLLAAQGRSETAAEPVEEETQEGDWFLGGMFTTREQEIERQRTNFERERAREVRLNEEARDRALAAEQRRDRHRKSTAAAAGGAAAGAAAGSPAAADGEPASDGVAATGGAATPGTAAAGSAANEVSAGGPAAGAAASDGVAATGGPAVKPRSQQAASATSPSAAVAARAQAGGSGQSPTAPGPDAGESGGRRRGMWWTVGGIALLAAGLVLGYVALQGITGTDEPEAETTSAPAVEDEPTESPEPTETEPEGPDPVVVSVTDLDPEGDGEENPGMVDNVLSDDPGHWQTSGYASEAFGGLKSGLGLVFELEEESTVSAVTIDSPDSGSSVEIRVGDSDDPYAAEVVAEASLEGTPAEIELDEPESAQYVFVWYTELAPVEEGFRGLIYHVEID